jgi:hypothetical protein
MGNSLNGFISNLAGRASGWKARMEKGHRVSVAFFHFS